MFCYQAQEEDTNMVQQYLTSATTLGEETEKYSPQGFFSGLTFRLDNMDSEAVKNFSELIVSNGGTVASAVQPQRASCNYVVAEPTSHSVLPPVPEGTIVVNTLWIEDCVDQEELVERELHHRHVRTVDPDRLAGNVISLSGIQGRLRDFLQCLIRHMGGTTQVLQYFLFYS